MSGEMIQAIVVAVITAGGALLGTVAANRKSSALIAYRLEQLEQKVAKHNNVIERTFKIENRLGVYDEKIANIKTEIDEIKKEVK